MSKGANAAALNGTQAAKTAAGTKVRPSRPNSIEIKFEDPPADPQLQMRLRIARSLARARVKKEWTQKELARRADTTQARISELESLRGDPQMWTVEQVARVLGLELQLVPVDP